MICLLIYLGDFSFFTLFPPFGSQYFDGRKARQDEESTGKQN